MTASTVSTLLQFSLRSIVRFRLLAGVPVTPGPVSQFPKVQYAFEKKKKSNLNAEKNKNKNFIAVEMYGLGIPRKWNRFARE